MNTITKKLIYLLLGIVIVTGLVIGYFYSRKDKIVVSELIKAVPVDASLIIECKDLGLFLEEIRSKSEVWNLIRQTESMQQMDSTLSWLQKVVLSDKDLQSASKSSPLIISIHLSGKNRYDCLFLMRLGSRYSNSSVETFLKKEFGDSLTITEREYNGQQIFESQFGENHAFGSMCWSVVDGVLLMSPSSILIEEGLRQLQSGYTLLDKDGFQKVLGTAGNKVNANIYINYQTFPKFLARLLHESKSKDIQSIAHFADWTEIDFHIKQNMLLMNGFTHADDSLFSYLNLFLSQQPVSLEFADVTPATVTACIALGIDNYPVYFSDLKKYLEEEGRLSGWSESFNQMRLVFGADPGEWTAGVFDGEAIIAWYPGEGDKKAESLFMMKINSKSQAEESLTLLTAKDPAHQPSEIKIDEETSFPLYYFPSKDFAGLMFGSMFSSVNHQWCTIIDNYLVFAATPEILKQTCHLFLLQKTLKNDTKYKLYAENLDNKTNLQIYLDLASSAGLLEGFLSSDLHTEIEKNTDIYRQLDPVAVQVTVTRKMLYSTIIIKYNPNFKEKTHTVWESHLDTTLSQKPYFVVNHTTNEKEVFVQDDLNNIYLINSTGRVVWKTPLPERIMSDVIQVDCMKNKKLQYLFNTKNYLYLVDRNGNFVDRFPIRFKAPATNAISVFDYEDKLDYRIFVACEDHQVYCYDIGGNVINGWQTEKTDHFVYQPVQHFRVDEKDYIVFSDSLKTYILDRKGNERVKVAEYFPRSYKARLQLFSDKSMIVNDLNATLRFISLDGKVSGKKLDDIDKIQFLDIWDIDNDGQKEVFIISGETFLGYSNQLKQLFSIEMEYPLPFRPTFYQFPQQKIKIGLTVPGENKIYLFNDDGTVYKGFPLDGCTPFSIGHFNPGSGNFNLVVGSRDGFLYNYEVN